MPDTSGSPAALIASDAELRSFCATVREAPMLALDTEFVRVRTYYPELCLIQVATEAHLACIDPLAGVSLDPLLALLHDAAAPKVMHAGRQDLELLYLLDGRLPAPLFDTQIAAALLGHHEQIGYGKLVESVLGITLAKAHTRTDWAQRPLTDEQLAYAAEDVSHLATLHGHLHAQLAASGRLAWLLEDSAALLDPALYRIVPEDMWQRIKGHAGLRGPERRTALALLAAWREREAMARNRPRQWILRDAPLLALARTLPASRARLSHLPDLPRPVVERYADTLLELLARARSGEDDVARAVFAATDPDRVDALVAVVRRRAAEHGLSPSVLAPRREVTALLRGERDLALLRGWRADLIGRELLALAASV